MAIRDYTRAKRYGMFGKLNNVSILAKEFGEQDNDGQDSMTWHNRELDWYNAERRFIFAAPDGTQRSKWIKMIMKKRD